MFYSRIKKNLKSKPSKAHFDDFLKGNYKLAEFQINKIESDVHAVSLSILNHQFLFPVG